MFYVSLIENHNPTGYEIEIEPDFIDSIDFSEIQGIIFGACKLLHKSNHLEFRVSGFGSDSWGLDISTDFMIIVEQLPRLFEWIDGGGQGAFNLDFYEQGVELRVIFSLTDNQVQINCESLDKGEINPITEFCEFREFNIMFSKVLMKFITEAKSILFPMLENNRCFDDWCESNNLGNRLISE
jgi:hypothetical protein